MGGSSGYGYDYYCFIYPEECGGSEEELDSIQDLIDKFESAPQNNDLVAQLRGNRGKVISESIDEFDMVVSGNRYIQIIIKNGGGGVIFEPNG